MKNIKKFTIKKFEINEEDSDSQFLHVKFYAVCVGQTLNQSNFLLESLENSKDTVYNKPILAAFNSKIEDFEGHESDVKIDAQTLEPYDSFLSPYAERVIGIIHESSNVQIENYRGKPWLSFDGLVFKEYAKEVVDVLLSKVKNAVSVEIDIRDGYIDNDILYIRSWEFLGITLLGNHVPEGVPGAHMILKDYIESEEYKTFKKEFSIAYEKLNKENIMKEIFISKDEIGKDSAIKINKTKDGLSEISWGSVDKSNLVKKLYKASNWRSCIQACFMKLEDGWQDGKEGSCKYHVMCIENGELVYNEGGLSSALGYAKKEGESGVVSKVNAIRKKLGLDESQEKESKKLKMENIDPKYKLLFSTEDIHLFVNKESHKVFCLPMESEKFEVEKLMEVGFQALYGETKVDMGSELCKMAEDADAEKQELSEKVEKLEAEKLAAEKLDSEKDPEEPEEDDKGKKEMEVEKEKFEVDKAAFEAEKVEMEEKLSAFESEKAELVAKVEKLEAEKVEMEAKFAEKAFEDEKKSMEKELESDDADEDDALDSKEKECFSTRIASGEFKTIEDFQKELAFAKYTKAKKVKESKKEKLTYSFNNPKPNKTTVSSNSSEALVEAVEKQINKNK